MNKADLVAVWVKNAKFHIPVCNAVVVGGNRLESILNNPAPCDPPDYNQTDDTFCGLKLIRAKESIIAVAIKLNI